MNKFITFEGTDGVGKTTQINLFLEKLKNNNLDYVLFREPGGTELSEKIRDILLDKNNKISDLGETLLFLSARSDLVDKKIYPSLKKTDLYVVCDRFLDSTLAYQSYGRGVDLKLIKAMTKSVTRNIIPSTTFLLDCDIDLAISRIGETDRMESSGRDFLLKVKNGFLELAKLNKNRYVIVDANKNITDVQNYIWNKFESRYLK
tara:strand:- start:332 stop:943 length:612 start_codon:yes stop_codon:yes gene_type:complete